MNQQPQGVVPHLVIEGAADALDFYKQALGATEVMRMPAEDGKRLMHAAMIVNGCHIYLMDSFPEFREQCGGSTVIGPKENGATTFVLHLQVRDCDAAVAQATNAGCTIMMAPHDAFWGDRYGQVLDPYGHAWSFAHTLPIKQS